MCQTFYITIVQNIFKFSAAHSCRPFLPNSKRSHTEVTYSQLDLGLKYDFFKHRLERFKKRSKGEIRKSTFLIEQWEIDRKTAFWTRTINFAVSDDGGSTSSNPQCIEGGHQWRLLRASTTNICNNLANPKQFSQP